METFVFIVFKMGRLISYHYAINGKAISDDKPKPDDKEHAAAPSSSDNFMSGDESCSPKVRRRTADVLLGRPAD